MKELATVHLVAGHSYKDSGAVSNHPLLGNIKEAEFNIDLRNLIAIELQFKFGFENFTKDNDKHTLTQVIADLRGKVKPQDLVVDIHFNAGPPSATGTESFTRNLQVPETVLSKQFCQDNARIMEIRNRGAKPESQTARGRIAILHLPCQVVLPEICFISNPTDVTQYHKWRHIVSHEMARRIKDYVTNK